MLRFSLLFSLFLPGCDRLPESFPPPAQQASLETSGGLAHFAAMNDPGAAAYLVGGFREKNDGAWRWALEHPVMRFYLPAFTRVKFTMAFVLPEETFRVTGPVTLTFSINGRILDRARYEKPGEQQYTHQVPAEFLKPEAINIVGVEPDKVAAPHPGEKLSFLLIRAGFSE